MEESWWAVLISGRVVWEDLEVGFYFKKRGMFGDLFLILYAHFENLFNVYQTYRYTKVQLYLYIW